MDCVTAGTTARPRPSRSTFGLIGCALSAYHLQRLSRHSPYSGATVRVESLSGTYATNFVCGKRIA